MQAGTIVPMHDKTANAVNTDNRTLRANRRGLYIIHFDKADAGAIGIFGAKHFDSFFSREHDYFSFRFRRLL